MITSERRRSLLEAMAALGQETSPRTFLLPRAAKRILDPSVVVVLGSRGSGKTALARFAVEMSARVSRGAYRLMNEFGAPWGLWFDAFSQASMHHPDASVLDQVVRGASDESLRDYWLSNLVTQLSFHSARLNILASTSEPTPELRTAVDQTGRAVKLIKNDPSTALVMTATQRATLITLLDAAEQSLIDGQGQLPPGMTTSYVTAVYDDLDAIGAFDPTLRARFIRGLLAMWSSLSTRYRHLRAKIFLPADLFDTRQFDTVDASKLLANAARIEWDTLSLYRLVLRHLAQHGDDTRAWLRDFGLDFDDLGPELGWMPREPTEEAVARWLGASLRAVVDIHGTRSPVQRWIPNRLRDGRDRVAPRTMLKFFSGAADLALRRASASHRGRLLDTTDAVDALAAAGEHRVAEIRGIYEWVDRLGALRGRVLPLPRAEVERLVASDPDDAPKPTRLRDGRTVTEELVRLGMLRELGVDDLLDVPDSFLGYFGALRTAGEARPALS